MTRHESAYVWEIERLPHELPQEMPRDEPMLQIVPHEREIDHTPAAVIIRPPIDQHGNFRPW